MPTATVSALAFAGPQRDTLIVMSSLQLYDSFSLSSSNSPLSASPPAGQVFVVTGFDAVGRAGRRVSNYF